MNRDASIILFMRIVGAFLWLVYTIILARTLDKADFSVVLYNINFALFVVLLITVGRDVAILRFASIAWANGARADIRIMLRDSRKIVLYNGSGVTFLLLMSSYFGLQTPVTNNLIIALLAGLLSLTGAQMSLNRDCLRAIGKVWQSQLGLNIIRSLIPLLGCVFVYFLREKLSPEEALALLLCSLVISLVIEEIFLRAIDWTNSSLAKAFNQKEVKRAGLTLWPGDIANALLVRSVGLVGALALHPEAAAILLAAERIAGIAQFPIAAASQAAAPRIAQATRLGNEEVQHALNLGSVLMTVGTLMGCATAGILALPAVWALGPDFLSALPIAVVLIVASLAPAFFGLAQPALHLTGKYLQYSIVSVISSILTATGIWFATLQYGGIGAAIAWCIGWWITNIFYTILLKSISNLNVGVFSLYYQAFAYVKKRK